MEKTPVSLRKHIAIIGKTNAGKSTLFNALLGQDVSIVSEFCGTTTDPVIKTAELIPFGPVAFIDTAGFGDDSELGEKRIKKTDDVLKRADLIIYVKDVLLDEDSAFEADVPIIEVYTKCDVATDEAISKAEKKNKNAIFLRGYKDKDLAALRGKMVEELKKQECDDETLLGNILNEGSNVVMVIPIDAAAPKGRLILPQVQALRDCLDNGIKATVVKPDKLKEALDELPVVNLVVTDSQAFREVSEIVPREIPLTSFSMLLANQKGDIRQFLEGVKAVSNLEDGDEVLFLEACTHNTTHEDIGRVKIPNLLRKKTGKELKLTYFTGYDFPDDIEKYKLVIHCGACMINKREIQNRLKLFEEKKIPVTNYGVILAYFTGIADRTSEIFV